MKPTTMFPVEYARTEYFITVSPDTTVSDVLNPEFYAHISNRLRVGDMIELRAEDLSNIYTVLVLRAERTQASVSLIQHIIVPLPGRSQSAHSIRWAGPKVKFRIVRDVDKVVVQEGFATAPEASTWLAENGLNG